MVKKRKTFSDLYENFKSLYTLYKIEQEALTFCYDENKDYSHVFALDTIFSDKFKKAINEFGRLLTNE